MAASLNRVEIIGNVGQPAELRYTPEGSPVCNFTVAVNHVTGGRDGSERKQTVEWFSIVCWHKLAELCNQYVNKGMSVYVEGRQQTRKWTGQDGIQRYKTELVANRVLFLERSTNPPPVQEIEQLPPEPEPIPEHVEAEDLPF